MTRGFLCHGGHKENSLDAVVSANLIAVSVASPPLFDSGFVLFETVAYDWTLSKTHPVLSWRFDAGGGSVNSLYTAHHSSGSEGRGSMSAWHVWTLQADIYLIMCGWLCPRIPCWQEMRPFVNCRHEIRGFLSLCKHNLNPCDKKYTRFCNYVTETSFIKQVSSWKL